MNNSRSAGATTKACRRARYGFAISAFGLFWCRPAQAQLPAYGVTGAHDPSTLLQTGTGDYLYFCTGQGIVSRYSNNMEDWDAGPSVFSTPPAWTETAVPGFTGDFWAPDVAYFNGIYHLYYAVSTFGSQVSAIGMAENTTLNFDSPNYNWVDQGSVIQSTTGSPYNTIDPSILVDTNGSVWMSFGSYWNGIYLTQINPSTGKPLNSSVKQIADNSQIEASYLFHQGNYYYLFVNFGMCCMGVDSTYNIRMGRSTSVNGPYLDENGVNMVNGGGTLLLGSQGRYIGPGQIGIMPEGNVDWMSYHYYDGDNDGTPTYALQQLYWTNQGWPTVTAPAAEALTWNNAGARGDGVNWDVADNQNWQDSVGAAIYDNTDTVTFNNSNNGHYSVTLSSTIYPGPVVFNSTGNYTLSGTGAIAGSASLTKSGTGTTTISTANIYTGGTNVNGGTLVIAPTSTANTVALPDGPVSIGASGTLLLADNASASSPSSPTNQLMQMTSLTIAPGGVLDVRNNHFFVADPGGAADDSTFTSLLGEIKTGAIKSTEGFSNYGVGLVDGNDHVNGAAASANQIEVAYTLEGDANLDGKVDASDFSIFASNFGLNTTLGWEAGDFNYDGKVDASDFSAFAPNFGLQDNGTALDLPVADMAALDAFAAANGLLVNVPEPDMAAVTLPVTIALLHQRKRRKQMP